ncbi:TetR/AcrR family transcriptional regulator [Sphingomonas sp. SUN039]|uniref:TetR/AcrR family transcriptional regulator n=1 Tax=Sphingomonas sp. SUN039 TaxID=2937787 RepID=UPI002164B7FF|nr:TetR/AcrR family transcriptional regulator [Sphingomonas sp. SUN039]UVO54296.1 TetR/AcrR family transcriptional regulator [Sphingomonas sp. SUN039]
MTESLEIASPRSRPAAGRPTSDQAAARHAELLDTALDMFLDRGFEPTTMEGVAAAVGMTKRTIYARYADKAALFIATVQRAIERLVVAPETLAALDSGDLETTLTAVARMRVAQVMTPAGLKLQRIINTESYRFPQIFNMSYEQGAGPVIAFLADLLRRHDNAGAVCVDRPEMAANVFMSMVVSGPVRILVSGNLLNQQEIDERVTFAVRLFLDGVRTR